MLTGLREVRSTARDEVRFELAVGVIEAVTKFFLAANPNRSDTSERGMRRVMRRRGAHLPPPRGVPIGALRNRDGLRTVSRAA